MKADLLTSVMKTIGSTQNETIRTAIEIALDTLNEQANQSAETTINNALDAFSQAKSAHTENMLKLNDIEAAITRSEKERQNALNESAEAEQNWRIRFRELRGMMTPELKAEHGQRVAGRELAEEFATLIDELMMIKPVLCWPPVRQEKNTSALIQMCFLPMPGMSGRW